MTESRQAAPRVELGQLLITPAAQQVLTQWDVTHSLARHVRGDWGDVDRHDWDENELALSNGLRLLSVYRGAGGNCFWIITEADRSATTILLPEEY